MFLKNATVYWNFKNGDGYILSGTNKIFFEENYWTFAKIKKRSTTNNIKLELVGKKCKIYSGANLNLRKIGGLLGFPENQVIKSGRRKFHQTRWM